VKRKKGGSEGKARFAKSLKSGGGPRRWQSVFGKLSADKHGGNLGFGTAPEYKEIIAEGCPERFATKIPASRLDEPSNEGSKRTSRHHRLKINRTSNFPVLNPHSSIFSRGPDNKRLFLRTLSLYALGFFIALFHCRTFVQSRPIQSFVSNIDANRGMVAIEFVGRGARCSFSQPSTRRP